MLSLINNEKKTQLGADKLKKLIQEAKDVTDDYEKLAGLIKQIEKFYGQEIYTHYEKEINLLNKKLAALDPKKYQATSQEEINNRLGQEGVKKSDLDKDIQKEIEDL